MKTSWKNALALIALTILTSVSATAYPSIPAPPNYGSSYWIWGYNPSNSTLVPLQVDSNGVIQISALSLSLPTGAATVAKQPAIGTAGTPSVDVLTVQGAPSMTPISVSASLGALTDRSGSITSGGAAQQLAAINSTRKYLVIQNTSNADLWYSFTTTATVGGAGSYRLPAGATFISDIQFVSTQAVSIIGATTGQTWTASEN